MKSKIIQNQKRQCELSNKITFTTFSFKDSNNFQVELGVFPNLEKEFMNGVKIIFVHKIPNKENFKFMTIIFCDSFMTHQEDSIQDSLKLLIGKKIRLYDGIFEYHYFDFEDQCYPTKSFKMKEN